MTENTEYLDIDPMKEPPTIDSLIDFLKGLKVGGLTHVELFTQEDDKGIPSNVGFQGIKITEEGQN